jgi:hypothetical protein
MYSEFYSDGTVTLTSGSASVVGTGTAWDIFGVAGGVLFVGDRSFPIASVEDDTHLTLRRAATVTVAGAAYDIGLISAVQVRSLQANTLASEILARNVSFAFDADAAGSLAGRDAHDGEAEGFRYGVFDDPETPVFYRKASDSSGDWAGPFKWRGPSGAVGPAATLAWIDEGWQDETDYVVNNGLAHNGSSYRAIADHTSSAATEPGLGADWETVWEVAAAKGDKGDKGWTIEPELVVDGQRVVLRIASFIGGEGDTPSGAGLYVGSAGLTANIAEAIDVRGSTGPQGARGLVWRGPWEIGNSYQKDDLVTSNDGAGDPAAWVALQASTGSEPKDNPLDWDFFPGSFPLALDYGLVTAVADQFDDYGSIA